MNSRQADLSTVLLVRQSRRALFRSLTAEQAAVVLVRSGEKSVRSGRGVLRIAAGSLGVLPARSAMTIENRPGTEGCYTANALVLDPNVMARARRDGLPDGEPLLSTDHDRTVAAFERAASALDDPLVPQAIKDHAVREVLLWLAQDGLGFGPDRPVSFAQRLRSMLAAAPDASWRAREAAHALAVSEATLRRRLAAEATAFGDLLADVRMTHALGLLQTTELPVNRIALDCGYASPSRFAIRFRERFGIPPSHVRTGDPERIGTAGDRIGTAEDRGRP